MGDALRAVDEDHGANAMRDLGDLLDGVDSAEHVRHLRDGDDLRLVGDLRQHVVPDQLAVVVDLDELQVCACSERD